MPVVVRDGADLYWNKTGAGPALILGAWLNGSGMWWDGCSSRPDLMSSGSRDPIRPAGDRIRQRPRRRSQAKAKP